LSESAIAIIARCRIPPEKLVWVLTSALLGSWDPNAVEHLDGLLHPLLLGDLLVCADGLRDLHAHPVEGVEGGHRVLEDHADLGASDLLDLVVGHPEEVLALEQDLALDDRRPRAREPHDRQETHALAGAGLPHHAEGLPRFDRERDAVDGLNHPVFRWEAYFEVLDLEERNGHQVYLTRGSRNA